MEDSALNLGDGLTIKERHADSSMKGKAKVMLEDSVLQLKVASNSKLKEFTCLEIRLSTR